MAKLAYKTRFNALQWAAVVLLGGFLPLSLGVFQVTYHNIDDEANRLHREGDRFRLAQQQQQKQQQQKQQQQKQQHFEYNEKQSEEQHQQTTRQEGKAVAAPSKPLTT